MVVVPLLLSVTSSQINVSADQSSFAIGVQLNQPAAAQGVTVRLQLTDEAARVDRDSLNWPAGSSGLQSFWLSLQSVPVDSRLLVQLVQPQGAVLNPAAAATEVQVQSPMVAFLTNLGYYRGVATAPLMLHFNITGNSTFPSEFAFSTFLLPGSRPPALPCQPVAASCSVADLEAVDNSTVTGTRWLWPGQTVVEPVQLPITWDRLPPEAELRIGVRIMPKHNVRVADQGGDVAAIVFGTPPGHCPPDGACFGSSRAVLVRGLRQPGRYIALLPPKPSGAGKLLLASSRWGDVVVVDATACAGLNSSRFIQGASGPNDAGAFQENYRLFSFDIETTGLSPSADAIIEMAAVDVATGTSWETLVKPEPYKQSSKHAFAAHGITESMLRQPDVPTFRSAWQQLVDFIQRHTPVVRGVGA
eukprot:gene11082-11238_t